MHGPETLAVGERELSTSHMPDEEKEEDDMVMANWKRKTQVHCHLSRCNKAWA